MRVDLVRCRDVRVAEDDLSILGRDAERLEQRSRGVPQVMQPDSAQTVVLADTGERPVNVARLDRQAAPGGEDQACVRPRDSEVLPSHDVATYGFEDLQLYREMATNLERRSLPEVGGDEPFRNLATDVLRRWAENLPEPVVPKY